MGKKGGKGKKEAEPVEPPHDPGWERAVERRVWDRPLDALPDPAAWPTWGALRERILCSCETIKVTWSPSVQNKFVTEMFRLSPPELKSFALRGSVNVTKVSMSPSTSCPSLEDVDMNSCRGLTHVLIQSNSLKALNLARCPKLTKVILQCPQLETLNLEGCDAIETLILWSDSLETLDVSSSTELSNLRTYCPNLKETIGTLHRANQVLKTQEHMVIAEKLAQDFLNDPNSNAQELIKPTGMEPFIVPRIFKL